MFLRPHSSITIVVYFPPFKEGGPWRRPQRDTLVVQQLYRWFMQSVQVPTRRRIAAPAAGVLHKWECKSGKNYSFVRARQGGQGRSGASGAASKLYKRLNIAPGADCARRNERSPSRRRTAASRVAFGLCQGVSFTILWLHFLKVFSQGMCDIRVFFRRCC